MLNLLQMIKWSKSKHTTVLFSSWINQSWIGKAKDSMTYSKRQMVTFYFQIMQVICLISEWIWSIHSQWSE